MLFLAMFLAGMLVNSQLNQRIRRATLAEEKIKESNYPFLARRIFLESPSDVIINFTDLRTTLQGYTTKFPETIGFYFEYLPTGNSIGVNEKEIFYAASLLKVPMAMQVYKEVEEGTLSFNEKLTIKSENIDKRYGALWQRGTGTEISIAEALKLSVVESDNTAFFVLRDRVKDHNLKRVFDYLDIPQDLVGSRGGVTPKNYSSVLRSLYFSAFLSFESSNSLLELMNEHSSGDLLRRGVPEEIKIANKFGTSNTGDTKDRVFSDCGVVYVPQRNYILCVMIKGADEDTAGVHIGRISRTIYEFIKSVD